MMRRPRNALQVAPCRSGRLAVGLGGSLGAGASAGVAEPERDDWWRYGLTVRKWATSRLANGGRYVTTLRVLTILHHPCAQVLSSSLTPLPMCVCSQVSYAHSD